VAYTDLGIAPPPGMDVAAQMAAPPTPQPTGGQQLGAQPQPPAEAKVAQPPGLPGGMAAPGEPDLNVITTLIAKFVQLKPGIAPIADNLITKLATKMAQAGMSVPQTPTDAFPDSGGAIQTAVNIEMELAKVKDPELLPDIRYFIATMREEITRDLSKEGGAPAPPTPLGASPAVNMGTKIPISV